MDRGGCLKAGTHVDFFYILLSFWPNCVTKRLHVVFQWMKHRYCPLARDGESFLPVEFAFLSR